MTATNSPTARRHATTLQAAARAMVLHAALALGAGLLPGVASAEPVMLSGVTFSDELGGFRILDGSGSGTAEDPFVLIEEIFDPREAVLTIRGAPEPTPRNPRYNRLISGHAIGFALRKVVINATDRIWTGFDLELQSVRGQPSPHNDGLSFGQGLPQQSRAASDAFETLTITNEPFDSIVFNIGDVPPGGRIVLDFVITDLFSRPAIYLVQRHQRIVSERPGGPWLAQRTPPRDEAP